VENDLAGPLEGPDALLPYAINKRRTYIKAWGLRVKALLSHLFKPCSNI